MHEIVIYSICIIGLFIASLHDLKKREVPDWLNYSLIASGLGLNLLFTAVYWDYSYIINSIIGFTIFFIIAVIMYYSGQWGGGDSKTLMGLGALIGLKPTLSEIPLLGDIFINILLVGAVYGIFYGIYLAFKHIHRFSHEFLKLYEKKFHLTRNILLIISIILFVSILFLNDMIMQLLIIVLITSSWLIFITIIFLKSVEKVAMLKKVLPSQLTEGDWIAKDIDIDGKKIAGPKDLGVEKEQIKQLILLHKKKKLDKVLIKEGIPFTPSFFLAFIVTIIWGNLVMLVL